MAVGYNLLWDVLALLPLVLMVVSYSRVVYTLWFKRNYDFQNNQHQMVSHSMYRIQIQNIDGTLIPTRDMTKIK